MTIDFDKILQAGSKAAESAKKTAAELADKGKKQVNLVNEQSKLARAQRQLGALVYSLHVNGEENQPLVDKYIEAIAEVEKAIEEIKANMSPEEYMEAEQAEAAAAEAEEEIEEEPVRLRGETKICPVCNSEVDGDALFCNHCGAQL